MSTAVYVHIPFCASKCKYCDFLSMYSDDEVIGQYFTALYHQLAIESKRVNDGVSSIYIGGGTPSFVDIQYIETLMEVLREHFYILQNAEISMEANPASGLDSRKWRRYKEAGINRLSFGLQSTHERHLKALGRIHSLHDFVQSYEGARKAGFDNINVDLIYALPDQSLKEYEESLRFIADMEAEHISAYSLIIEEGTRFYSLYSDDECRKQRGEEPHFLCAETTELQMMRRTKELLSLYGYDKYEISNYAKKGMECKHNITYWERGDYFGFGLGAASLFCKQRFSAIRDINAYINLLNQADRAQMNYDRDALYEDCCILEKEDEIKESMMLGLRLTNGIEIDKINRNYGVNVLEHFKDEIKNNEKHGLLKVRNGRIYLTEAGMELANVVMKDFV